MADERREAVEAIKGDRVKHDRETGVALPDSRKIENWGAEIGRRNDRKDSDRKGGR